MIGVMREDVFSTAIWKSPLPGFGDYKEIFLSALRKKRESDPIGIRNSNFAGYHSKDDLMLCEELAPFFRYLMNEMVPAVVADCSMTVNNGSLSGCWVNFNDKLNSINIPHKHDGILSGVFYVNLPPGSGKLVLTNDSCNDLWKGWQLINFNSESAESNPYIRPNHSPNAQEGWIYLWHSYLEHYVTPNIVDVERVSISFNINLCFKQESQTPIQVDKWREMLEDFKRQKENP